MTSLNESKIYDTIITTMQKKITMQILNRITFNIRFEKMKVISQIVRIFSFFYNIHLWEYWDHAAHTAVYHPCHCLWRRLVATAKPH